MNPFEMVVMIVAIVTIGRVVSARYGGGNPLRDRLRGRLRDRMAMLDEPRDDEETLRLRGEVTRLNERIQVLERLATDPAKRLSDEIDQLKNQ
ncbi:MAG: hypothetical protein RL490_1034 [Pseudomonadota bacterium]|jgi:hypothetical protein